MLSDKVKELIKKARIVSFATWQGKYSAQVIDIFQRADDEGRYLSDEDLQRLKDLVPELEDYLAQARLLRDQASNLVDQARKEVLAAYPNITEPGGGLYPPIRAEACWRDFWHFLRCISYAVGGASVDYLSEQGLGYMEQLYQELQVPLDAMILGLEQLKFYSLQETTNDNDHDLEPYFDQLINNLKEFANG
ncbi:Phycobilisome protein [Xenococcus sp. PCC 7305]|uniref:phycobilisome protein n=1 Tax=Xenococcus sp. PCC 7305 TaxID=102125 RepID=UPI0002AC80AE|nr:phycobilisome protein [Xenococcus sp. PCC 7305]ELS02083.1 Phycobilisome protein [Xenococcus sp. PCC 7305]